MVTPEFIYKAVKELYANKSKHISDSDLKSTTSYWFNLLQRETAQGIQGAIHEWNRNNEKIPRAEDIIKLLGATEAKDLTQHYNFSDRYMLEHKMYEVMQPSAPENTDHWAYEWIKLCQHVHYKFNIDEIANINKMRSMNRIQEFQNFTNEERQIVFESLYGKEEMDKVHSITKAMHENNFNDAIFKMEKMVEKGVKNIVGKMDKFISAKEGSEHPQDYEAEKKLDYYSMNMPGGYNPELGF